MHYSNIKSVVSLLEKALLIAFCIGCSTGVKYEPDAKYTEAIPSVTVDIWLAVLSEISKECEDCKLLVIDRTAFSNTFIDTAIMRDKIMRGASNKQLLSQLNLANELDCPITGDKRLQVYEFIHASKVDEVVDNNSRRGPAGMAEIVLTLSKPGLSPDGLECAICYSTVATRDSYSLGIFILNRSNLGSKWRVVKKIPVLVG